jgi:uncharacterized surface protein with fasciclin (FAS1) repeats
MKKIIFCSLLIFAICSCVNEDFDQRFSTFEEETVSSWLEKNSDQFSIFYNLMVRNGLRDLLNAYGEYTCFAPTNEAFDKFFESHNTTADKLTDAEVREIVYQHIIKRRIKSNDFPPGALFYPNLDDRYLVFTYESTSEELKIIINDKVRVLTIDNAVHNGVIHTVNTVIEPTKIRLPEIIAQHSEFSLFNEALVATGLADSLVLYRDEDYEQVLISGFNNSHNDGHGNGTLISPQTHFYGYTAFIESDSLYAANGINSLDDMKHFAKEAYDKMYPEDANRTDITDRRNSLNRFIAYHLMDRMEAENEFIGPSKEKLIIPNFPIYEYREMMAPNTLMEVTNHSNQLTFNRLKNGTGVHIITPNITAENGLIHEIDKILLYDQSVESDVLNKRIRMDALSMFPELTTNKLRYIIIGDFNTQTRFNWVMPVGYLKGVTWLEGEGKNMMISATNCCHDYLGDEYQFHNKWDFTMRIPPIPAGTYEIRIHYIPWTERAVSQLYFDGRPCGIPLDMRFTATDSRIGWIADDNTEDDGVENDKMMHNRGYMKGSDVDSNGNGAVARQSSGHIRRIVTIATFDKTEPHYFRAKCVFDNPTADQAWHMNYFEFIPISQLQTEDRH